MKRIFTHLFVAVLLMLSSTSWAQLTEFEEGAVYRFVNRSTGRALNAGESGDGTLYVNATTVAADDLKQQWYVTKSGDYYVLRNLYYAKYLKGAITNKTPGNRFKKTCIFMRKILLHNSMQTYKVTVFY